VIEVVNYKENKVEKIDYLVAEKVQFSQLSKYFNSPIIRPDSYRYTN